MLTICTHSLLFPTVYNGKLTLCIPITNMQLHLLHDTSAAENTLLHETQRYKAQGKYRTIIGVSSVEDINVRFSYDLLSLILNLPSCEPYFGLNTSILVSFMLTATTV